MSELLPAPDSARIRSTTPTGDELVVLPPGTRLVRVHALGGSHPTAWDELRRFGPTKSRFDHHPLPRRVHPRRRIAYVTVGADAFTAALAEWFQDDAGGVAPFDLRLRQPTITLFDTIDDLRLLDLDGGWVTRAGGNQAIRTGPRAVCRDWARSIYDSHRSIDGLVYGSSVWGPGRCIALWDRSQIAFPAAPVATRLLDDPALADLVARAAAKLGSYVL